MPYQSIGQLNTAVSPVYNYVAPPVVAPKVNLGSIKDAATLTTALQNKQITPKQFVQRHSQLFPIGNTNTPLTATLGNALNKAAPVGRAIQSVPGVKAVTGAVSGAALGVGRAAEGAVTSTLSLPVAAAGLGNRLALIHDPKLNNAPVPYKPSITEPFSTGVQNITNKVTAPVNKLANATQAAANRSGKAGRALYVPSQIVANVASLGEGGANLARGGIEAVNAARGGDEAVSDLIANTRTNNLSNAVTKAQKSSNIGNVAVDNAGKTRIPVTDESSPAVTGKVTTPKDAQYIKASNQLSDQYEKELSNIKSVSSPVTQQVLQRNLDQKYNGLQQNLDDSYGKSSIDFKGQPPKPSTTSTLPRSALDNQPTAPFNSTKIPEPPKATPKAPTAPVGEPRIAGSALALESRAVQKGLVSDLGEKSTYTGGSYKQEADKAVQLVNENPTKAKNIALGNEAGDNTIHEVAVRRAVENKALQSGDVATLRQLGSSTQHTATAEAAQRLGAEGFSADHNSPVQAIREINATREKALASRVGKSGENVDNAVKDIQKTTAPTLKVSRQDWQSFIESIKC